MKLKLILAAALIAVLLTGCSNNADGRISYIGANAARDAALSFAGVAAQDAYDFSVELKSRDGLDYYKVEFETDGREHKYDVDAITGAVLSAKTKKDDELKISPDATLPTVIPDGAITKEEAQAIALSQVPGATDADIFVIKADYDDGRLEYEGTIYYNETEYEFEIDGYSGAIRSWEVESIYD